MGQMRRKPDPMVARVIDAFGGLASMQKALGHKHPTTIHSWQRRGRIPHWWNRTIIDAARANKVALPHGFGCDQRNGAAA